MFRGVAPALLIALSLVHASAFSAEISTPAPEEMATRCRGLVGDRFAVVPDAPTQIVSATVLAASSDRPQLCEVKGYVAPQVAFIVQLPLGSWNGKLMVLGCGGFCGAYENSINFPLVNRALELKSGQEALRRGYAITASTMGHYGTGRDGKWAYNNYLAEVDFAWRATHVNTVAAKAIIADYYGQPHRLAYFQGCSTGGRQGLMSAQRYPEDFNGIIAGAGPLYYSTSGFQLMWSALANIDAGGKQILREADVRRWHETVLASCDAIDGSKDGIIDDPRHCKLDFEALQCEAGSSDGAGSCFSAAQLDVVRKIYEGPKDSLGRSIHVGGSTPGSELNWLGQYIDSDTAPAIFVTWPEDKFRYMSFFEDPGPSWTWRDVDWNRDPARTRGAGVIYDATHPDLRRFRDSGGKLLTFMGWADQQVVPANFTDYYELVVSTMGGLEKTREFYRLFMLPGVGHCQGGPGADAVDYVSYLENWVEKGIAPEQMLAEHHENGAPVFSRPLVPYPDTARYSGRGDPNDARNWRRVKGPAAK